MNKVLRKDETLFKSHELALIAALVAWKFQILYINKEDQKKAVFYFKLTPQLIESVQAFWNNEKKVSPIKYYEALRLCKSRIYGD